MRVAETLKVGRRRRPDAVDVPGTDVDDPEGESRGKTDDGLDAKDYVEFLRGEMRARKKVFAPEVGRGAAWEVLLGIWYGERRQRSCGLLMTELAAACTMSPSLARRGVDQLIEAGLVTRMRSHTDNRLVVVTLSVQGRRLFLEFLGRLKALAKQGTGTVAAGKCLNTGHSATSRGLDAGDSVAKVREFGTQSAND